MGSSGGYDVAIIGGGACGATTAFFLRREGLSIAVIDKGPAGLEASWASAGMIGPERCPQRDPWFLESSTLSRRQYDELVPQLQEITGRAISYGGDGHLVIARREDEAAVLRDLVEVQCQGDVEAHLLDGTAARQREPALPEDVIAAAWSAQGRALDARSYTAAIIAAGRAAGVIYHEGAPVTGLLWQGGRVTGVRCGEVDVYADLVINAAGAWAGGIDPRLTHPVYPFHGQVMAVAMPMCGLRHNIARAGGSGYCTPRFDGRVIVGATHDQWGFQKKLTPEGLGYLGGIVQRVLPALAEQPVLDTWSGFRPGSHDGLPTLGADPRANGGYLWATGHSTAGMMQMPATALVLTDLVMQRPPRITIDALSVSRHFADALPLSGRRELSQFMAV